MTAETRPAPRSAATSFDPFRFTWRLLTNVKFALLLVGVATGASLLGVVIPQVPVEMRGNPAARSAWIELRREDFGPFTGAMDGLDLFDVFHAPWFIALWGVIIVAVTVCTVSRFRPTARSVHRPQTQVADHYFDMAKHRASFTHPGGAGAVEQQLRKRRYSVERTHTSGAATYLFAERFSWSQYGTFLTHLALLMLLIGGALTAFGGFQRTMALAEGRAAAPLFSDPGSDQVFIEMLDAHQGIDADGNIVDFHSDLSIRRGGETVLCTTTVNDPCNAFGYRFHQAAFFDDLARISITDPDGRLVFDDIVDFEDNATAVPHLQVLDESGAVIFDQAVPQMAGIPGGGGQAGYANLDVPVTAGADESVSYAVVWGQDGDQLMVALRGPGLEQELRPGEQATSAGHTIRYTGVVSVPAIEIRDMPGAVSEDGGVTVQMLGDAQGNPYLFVTGLDPNQNLVLRPGTEQEAGSGYSYRFERQVDASGIDVRRDPGDTFIWVAVAMAIVGLAITFYLPRRRLWVKVTPDRTQVAGIAERTTRFGRELRFLGADLGARDALLPGDREE